MGRRVRNKKKSYRLLALCMAVLMAISILPLSALAVGVDGLSGTAVDSANIQLSWVAVADSASTYEIYRSTVYGGPYTVVADSIPYNIGQHQDTGLSPDTTYYYYVKIIGGAQNGEESNIISVTTKKVPPTAPLNLTATSAGTSVINLSWSAVNGAEGYIIYRSLSQGSGYANIGIINAPVTTHSDTGLTPGTTYYYYVVAYNSGGNSPSSNFVSATTDMPPLIVTVTNATLSTLKVNWNSISGATGYTIYRSTNSSGPFAQVGSTAAGTLTFTNSGLQENTTYYYRVISSNGAQGDGNGKTLSQTLTVTVTDPTEDSLKVNWNQIVGASGYTIYRSTYNGGYALVQTIGTGTETSWVDDTALNSDTTYWYRVVASTGHDGANSGKTLAQTLTVTVTDPTTTSLKVNWNSIAGATSYQLYRSTDGVNYTAIGSPVTGNSYPDTGLNPDTTYHYKVVANTGNEGINYNKTLAQTLTLDVYNPTTSSLDLQWNELTGATGYTIYRSTYEAGGYTQLATVTGGKSVTYKDTGLDEDTTYYYKVVASTGHDAMGRGTTLSRPVDPQAGKVTLRISKVLKDKNTGENIGLGKEFRVRVKNEAGVVVADVTVKAGSYVDIPGLDAGVKYSVAEYTGSYYDFVSFVAGEVEYADRGFIIFRATLQNEENAGFVHITLNNSMYEDDVEKIEDPIPPLDNWEPDDEAITIPADEIPLDGGGPATGVNMGACCAIAVIGLGAGILALFAKRKKREM